MVFALNKMVEKFARYKFKEKELELVKKIACANGLEDLLESIWW